MDRNDERRWGQIHPGATPSAPPENSSAPIPEGPSGTGRFRSGPVRLSLLLMGIAVALGFAGYFSLSRFDWGGALLLGELQRLIEAKNLGALSVEQVSGNPLSGFQLSGVTLRGKNGAITADGIRLSFHPDSLLRRDPALRTATLQKLSAPWGALEPLLDAYEPEVGNVPPLSLSFLESTAETPAGTFLLERGRLRITDNASSFALSLEGALDGLSLAATGEARLRETLSETTSTSASRGMTLVLERGEVTLGTDTLVLQGEVPLDPEGAVSLEGTLRHLSLEEVARWIAPLAGDDATNKALLSARGTLSGSFRLSGTVGEPVAEGTARLEAGTLMDIPLEIRSARWAWQGKRFTLSDCSALVRKSPLSGTLSLDLEPSSPEMAVTLAASSLSLDAWHGEFPFLSFLSGTAAFLDLDLAGPLDGALRGHVRLRDLDGSVAGYTVADTTAEAELREVDVAFRSRGLWLGAPFTATGSAGTDDATSLNVRLTASSVPLHRLREAFPDVEGLALEGNLTATLSITGPAASPKVEGLLETERFRFRGEPLDAVALQATYEEKRFSLEKGTLVWRTVPLEFSGTVADIPGRGTLDLRGTAKDLSPELLSSLSGGPGAGIPLGLTGKGSAQWRLSGNVSQPVLSLQVTAPSLHVEGQVLSKVLLEGSLTEREFRIAKALAQFGGGEVRASGSVALGRSDGAVALKIDGSYKDISLKNILPEKNTTGAPLDGSVAGTFAVTGNIASPLVETAFQVSALAGVPLPVQSFRGKLRLEKGPGSAPFGRIRLQDLQGELWGGRGSISGVLDLPGGGKPAVLDLKGTLSSMDMANSHATLGDAGGVYLRGKAGGELEITGTSEQPQLRLKAVAPRLVANGFPFTETEALVIAEAGRIRLEKFQGFVGASPVVASMDALSEEGTWKVAFSASGKNLDLAAFSREWFGPTKNVLSGRFSFDTKGSFAEGLFSGSGLIDATRISLRGFRAESLKAPFTFQDEYVTVEDANAGAYGGNFFAQGTMNLFTREWGGNLRIESVDVAPALADLASLEGSVSGKGTFRVRGNGTLGRLFGTEAQGTLDVENGAFSGFPGIQDMAKATGGTEIPFRSLKGSFAFDTGMFYIIPGSRMAAPPGNPAYRYLSADGSVSLGGPLDLKCYGEINVTAFNAFLGALRGLIQAEGSSDLLLQEILGGLVGGASRRDFREVSFKVKGTLDAPSLEDISVSRRETVSPIPVSPGDPKNKNINEQVRITLSFPVGPGGGSSEDVGNQVQQQILEQMIKQIIKPGESSE